MPSVANHTAVGDTLVRLDQLTKDYGAVRALDNVTLEVGKCVTGLLGPNGAGKSTLIKALLGLVRFTGGKGDVLGFELGRQARSIRDHVGYMPEDDCYVAGLTGVEMVQFVARLSGLPAIEALRRAHEILDFCGIEQERYRAVETYSTGMRQKLKFAQAVVHDPPLLILDEPTAGLDPEERSAMLKRIRILADKLGKAAIVCTHILPDVQAICDHVIILTRGRVVISEQLEVLNRPTAPGYTVRLLGEGSGLADRLRKTGARVTVQENGTLVVESAASDLAQIILRHARESNVGVRTLVPARNSLEEIFMDAVQEGGRANS